MDKIKVIVDISYIYYEERYITKKIELQIPGSSKLEYLIEELKKLYPELNFSQIIILINGKLIFKNIGLQDGDKITLLPQLMGG